MEFVFATCIDVDSLVADYKRIICFKYRKLLASLTVIVYFILLSTSLYTYAGLKFWGGGW